MSLNIEGVNAAINAVANYTPKARTGSENFKPFRMEQLEELFVAGFFGAATANGTPVHQLPYADIAWLINANKDEMGLTGPKVGVGSITKFLVSKGLRTVVERQKRNTAAEEPAEL